MTQDLRPQIALFDAAPADITTLSAAAAVDWLVCRPEGERCYKFMRGADTVCVIDFQSPLLEMPDLVAILACSDDIGWEGVATSWQAAFPTSRTTVERVEPMGPGPGAEPEAVLRRALHLISDRLATQRAYAGRMALDLAAYRSKFELMQRKFAALEAHAASAAPPRTREILRLPPGPREISIRSGEPGADRASQLLPVDSQGVGGLWLSLPRAPEADAGALTIILSAAETGDTLAKWSVLPGQAGQGWLHLVLDRALEEAALTLRITVACEARGDATGGWALCLGPANPYPAFCVMTENPLAPAAPLALRVDASLPGARVPVTIHSVLAAGAARRLARALPLSVYETAAEVEPEPGDPAVHYDSQFAFIQVHPRGQGRIAAARLTLTPPPGTWCLSAIATIAHEEAQPACFGMFAVPQGTPSAAALPELDDGADGFSGWFSVAALERRTILVTLPHQGGSEVVLYLLTRQDGAPTFAWARFSDLAVHFLPG